MHHSSSNPPNRPLIIWAWLLVFALVFIWSAIDPRDRFTWLLEVLPAVIGLAILVLTYRAFRLTGLVYGCILLHCIILMVGGHYTYAEVPLFEYFKNTFGLERNNYDKVGHFAQGFVPALIAREILLRRQIIAKQSWTGFLVACICLALSAFYELIEWWVALGTGEGAEAFLGTQGYVWDTQSDMALALLGAVSALLFFSRLHNRQLQHLPPGCQGHRQGRGFTAE